MGVTNPVLGLSICGLACHNQGRRGTRNEPLVHVSWQAGPGIKTESGHVVGTLMGYVKPAIADQVMPRPIPSAGTVHDGTK